GAPRVLRNAVTSFHPTEYANEQAQHPHHDRPAVPGHDSAAPMAFAQSTTPTTRQTPTQSATGAAEEQRQQSGASGQGMGWADLDTDGNGSISRTEAQAHSALSSVFATADADGDGELTADEYRTFIQNQQQGGAAQE